MWEFFKKFWSGFSEIYAPAIVGGIFLCIADLFQSGGNGQLAKLGKVIAPPLRLNLEIELIGFFTILTLACLLCWAFRPANRGDSFSKGASVFAVLAALVPATITPGGLSSTVPLKLGPADKGASIIGSAHAQTVVPLVPAGKLVIRLVGGDGLTESEFQTLIGKDGISVSLLDRESLQKIGFEKFWTSRFEIVRPPKRYVLELEIGGFERVRGEVEVSMETRVVDVAIGKRTVVPLGIQRLVSATPLVVVSNERETLVERGKDASRRGQFAAAIDFYDKALASNAKDNETLNFKGYALFRLGKNEEAFKALQASRQINSNYFVARLNFAKVACALGRNEEASKALLKDGSPITQRQAQVALEDGEYLKACKTDLDGMKVVAGVK